MSTLPQKRFFSKVRIARELLREQAEAILAEYLDVVSRAKEAEDFETAAKALQWLMDHMPADEEGGRLVDASVDKRQEETQKGPTGPMIQLGISIGGLNQKQLPIKKPSELSETITAEIVE